ncbi:DNA polymerase [Shigella phage SGF2]|uniref:DNA polymerase n=1 Tax=Shigella phage SGF2 TaxID=2601630 RepID=A0A5C1K9R9_9CAUD|nr:DNA polymerase [Shigella phage SGF2]QEM42621.1 DNA polymerase [Shigella phage SGF2]
MSNPDALPFLTEMTVADIISKQAKHGVSFNRRNARWYVHLLKEIIVNIDKELIPLLPKMRLDGSTYMKPFKKSGALQKWPQAYCDRVGLKREDIGGAFTCVEYVDFDPSKDARVKEALMDEGFLPPEFNVSKKPWNTFEIKKDMRKYGTYQAWYSAWMRGNAKQKQTAEMVDADIRKFLEKHFRFKTKNYMKAYVFGLGLNPNRRRPITFDEIKIALATSNKWPTAPTNLEETLEEGLGGELGSVGSLLKRRVVAAHRLGLISGLIAKEREDGKLSAEANSCATPTFRFKHRIVVNIPSRGLFGHECRGLFESDYNSDDDHSRPFIITNVVPDGCYIRKGTNVIYEKGKPGKKDKPVGAYKYYIPAGKEVFLGYDGSGLELRMLAHYLIKECRDMLAEAIEENNPAKKALAERGLASAIMYRDILLEGDIHSHNQKLAGLPTRDNAKTFIYAFNYGAGDAKLGSIVGGGADEGSVMRARFLAENPCIAILIDRMTEKAAQGYLIGVDGRKITMRRDATGKVMVHKALNTLLQCAGAVVMKYAMMFLNKWIEKDKVRCAKVIDMHDEGQFSVNRNDVQKLKEHTELCVKKAGEYLNMECPLASDCQIGLNWMHTH